MTTEDKMTICAERLTPQPGLDG